MLFKVPRKTEPERLVAVESEVVDGVRSLCFPRWRWRARAGFALTDRGTDTMGALDQANYCMMKEICAQCLQVHRDPETGLESVVFSCFDQDQDLDRVDFACLRGRLRQNSVQEKLTRLWIDRSLRQLGLRPTGA